MVYYLSANTLADKPALFLLDFNPSSDARLRRSTSSTTSTMSINAIGMATPAAIGAMLVDDDATAAATVGTTGAEV